MDEAGGREGVAEAGGSSPHLSRQEQDQAAKHAILGPLVIHEIVREHGLRALNRSSASLAWSGLAAGLSIGFSFVLQAYLRTALPEAPWARLIDSFGYSLGFLIVVLGQQELFTETTLTALVPALTQRTLATMAQTLRVWMVVLAANLAGTIVFGAIAAQHGVFAPETMKAMAGLSAATMEHPFWQTLMRAVAAGWLIGLMVWLLPAAGPARPLIIVALTYAVAVCQFPHVIAGSVEAVYGVVAGQASLSEYLLRFLLPTLLGNSIGGMALVAVLNHAPLTDELGTSDR